MENVQIGKNAIVNYSILDEDTVVPEETIAGESREEGGKLNVFTRRTVFEKSFKERRKTK
jgi:ADP-glucose pyrophosphorylase